MVIFHSFVSLPEGNHWTIHGPWLSYVELPVIPLLGSTVPFEHEDSLANCPFRRNQYKNSSLSSHLPSSKVLFLNAWEPHCLETITNCNQISISMDWFTVRENYYIPYWMGKSMVSCRFSLNQTIQYGVWNCPLDFELRDDFYYTVYCCLRCGIVPHLLIPNWMVRYEEDCFKHE